MQARRRTEGPPRMVAEVKSNGQRYYRGMGAVASHLGITRHHLWYVIHGERRSPRVEAFLAANGVQCGRGV